MLALDVVGEAKGRDSPSLPSLSVIALPVVLLLATAIRTAVPSCSASPRCRLQKVLSSLLLQGGAAESGNAAVREPLGLGGSVQEVLLLQDGAFLPRTVCVRGSERVQGLLAAGGGRQRSTKLERAGGCISPAPIPPAQGQATPVVIPPSICAADTGVSGRKMRVEIPPLPLPCLFLHHAQGRDSFGLSVVGWYVPE